MTYPAAEQHMPVAHVWPPLLPHVSIEPVELGMLIVEALEVGPTEVGGAASEVIDAGAEELIAPVAATTAEGLSVSNGPGK